VIFALAILRSAPAVPLQDDRSCNQGLGAVKPGASFRRGITLD